MGYFLCVALILIAAAVITDIARDNRFAVNIGGRDCVAVLTVTFSGHDEHAELIIRSILKRYSWHGGIKNLHLIIADAGMDGETRKICDMLADEYECVDVCGKEQLCDTIVSKLSLQTPLK